MFNIFRRDFNIIRTTGSYVNGLWIVGSTTSLVVKASLQPASKTSIDSLPEGRRHLQTFKLFTSTKLNVADITNNSDKITYGNELLEVAAEEIWQNKLINHYCYLVQKIEVDNVSSTP